MREYPLVSRYMRLFPEERTAIVDALNELSHGVFVDSEAAGLWRAHYLASLLQALADPKSLLSRIGPEIVYKAPQVKVCLRFDVNTGQEG